MSNNNELLAYLSRFVTVTEDMAEALNRNSLINEVKKGTTLIRQGDFYNEAYFVLKGTLRSYTIKDGDDITIDFFLDEQAVMPIGAGNPHHADFYLESLEDSLVLVNNQEQEERMLKEFPILKDLCLQMSEYMAQKIQTDFSSYKTSTPEERYKKLMDSKPDLFNRVPQYQIASYLGIKPESLSRIKKRILA